MPQHGIAYEGLRREWLGKSPCATGDPVAMRWGPKTDLGLYGSGYVGMLGSVVSPTDVPRILRLDCLATDFFHDTAFPTFLCYNPYEVSRTISWDVGTEDADVYDAVTHHFLRRCVRGKTPIEIPADAAAVIVIVPAGLEVEPGAVPTGPSRPTSSHRSEAIPR